MKKKKKKSNRVSCAGTISPTEFTGTFYVSLLYTKDKLFALHQTSETQGISQNNNKVELTLLKDQLENITETLIAWKKSNEDVDKLYKDTATTTDINFSDGIVGFLSGTKDNITWEDGYLYANATVKNNKGSPTKENDGFTFTGAGAGAKWPVGKDENDQPYNFINSGFTLVATVTVGSITNSGDNSILGVGLTASSKNVGLWCTTGGKWGINSGDGQPEIQPSTVNCMPNKTYYIAVILSNNGNKISVYVNGQKLKKEGIDITSENVKHFYFGVDKDKTNNTDVNITDVLLYDMPFGEEKMNELKPKETIVADAQHTNEIETIQQTSIENKTETHTPQDTSTDENEKNNKQPSSPPPTTEDSAGRVGVVGVLCFMLFGVFTLLGRYVY